MNEKLELFLLRDKKGPILYEPLRQLTVRLNDGAARAVAKVLYDKPLTPEEEPVVQMLRERGFFTPAEHTFPPLRKPMHVTLFPSDGCNLRCRYCYAAAENRRHLLDPEIAKAAVDLVAQNAKEQNAKDFVVAFHGNGEPFTNFPLIQEISRYAVRKGEELGLETKLSAATNGALDEEKLDWLLAWFHGVNISCDLLPEVQDYQRPFADGRGSFALVDRTLKRLDDAGKHYGIRATVTSESVGRLEEMVLSAAARYPHCQQIHVEPAWECGRCHTTGETTPDTEEFIRQYLSAWEKLPKDGPGLVFSAAKTDQLSNRFCAASSDSFVVTAEGLVTSCYEVCEETDSRSGRFVYGRYDKAQKAFVFDEEKREALHRLTVENMPHCKDCFCKFHCAGDCPAKALELRAPEEHQGSLRCQITRAISLAQLSRKLDRAAEKKEEEHHGQ